VFVPAAAQPAQEAAQQPAQQAAGVLRALGSLRYGRWWPGLDEVVQATVPSS